MSSIRTVKPGSRWTTAVHQRQRSIFASESFYLEVLE